MHTKVVPTNLIRTGRLTRPLPIIDIDVKSPATFTIPDSLILNSGIVEQSKTTSPYALAGNVQTEYRIQNT